MRVVADASAVLEYLLGTDSGRLIGEVLREPENDLHVPGLCDVEVVSGLRRALRGRLGPARAGEALEDYLDLPLTRHGHTPLLGPMLDLRSNFSAYDAAYVALAERLEAPLLTADARLARAAIRHRGLATLP